MGNIYDLNYDQRIRIKYLVFGLILGVTGLAFLNSIGAIGGHFLAEIIQSEMTSKELRFNMVIQNGMFLMFVPLLYWLWYSKSKPKKRPDIEERIGLKHDWQEVFRK